ncbi:MAG: WD40 repeat domain-containing protein [Candidatus Poribacteria bacterium]|nr:WD40 repeat domain-containing protein [Candidatus Poribacteria bacterium]
MTSQRIDVDTDTTTWALPEGAIARLGRGIISSLEFSPDGKYLLVGTKIGLWWYELATMKPVALWETERGMLSALKFSSAGALLATGNSDGGIKIWDVQNHRCLSKMQRMGRFDRVTELVFSPDEQCLAASGGRYDAVYVWNIETGEQIAKFTVDEELQPRHRPPAIPLAFSPDGRLLIGGTPENTFSVWDIETGERRAHLTGHSAMVIYLLLSPCGEFLTSVDWDGGLHKWEVDKLTTKDPQPIITSMPEATRLVLYTYSADGILLAATASGTTFTVWDVERSRKVATLTYKETVRRFHFSQTGSQLVIGGTDTILQTWNIGDPAPQSPAIRDHYSVCGSVKFSPDGQTLAAGYWSGEIHLRDVQELKLQTTFRCESCEAIRSIDFSPCGNKLAATSYDKIVSVWNLEKPEAPPVELTGHQASLFVVAFSPKGDLLVSADANGVLGVWDVEHDYELQMFTEERDCSWSIAFSPDGKHLVSAHEKEKAQVWDIENGEQIAELSSNRPRDATKYKGDDRQIQRILKSLEKGSEDKRTPTKAIAFSPNGDLIAGNVGGQIWLWDTTTYEIRMVICLPQGCGRAEALTFSPCGRYLVSGASWLDRLGIDKVSIRLWDVATGENIATFWSHPTDIQSLAFSPDGTLLASGSYDGTILLWDMKPYFSPIDTH